MKYLLNSFLIVIFLSLLLYSSSSMKSKTKTADYMSLRESCVMVFCAEGHGSGAIVGKNCVLTAAHVAKMSNLMIRTNSNEVYGVVAVALDPDSDMALIYINREFTQKPLPMNKTPLKIEDEVVLIGTPSTPDLFNSVLHGRVVNTNVTTTGADWKNIDVLDTHGSPGTSGGPVIDIYGRIRGIVVTGCGNLTGAIPMEEFDI